MAVSDLCRMTSRGTRMELPRPVQKRSFKPSSSGPLSGEVLYDQVKNYPIRRGEPTVGRVQALPLIPALGPVAIFGWDCVRVS